MPVPMICFALDGQVKNLLRAVSDSVEGAEVCDGGRGGHGARQVDLHQ